MSKNSFAGLLITNVFITCSFFISFMYKYTYIGAILSGKGKAHFLCDFLNKNTSERNLSESKHQCQLLYFIRIHVANSCIWYTPIFANEDLNDNIVNNSSSSNTFYTFYNSGQIFDSTLWSLSKLIYRLLLSCYIAYETWIHYYRYYKVLILNLKQIGYKDYTSYSVIIGDPTSIILSNPIISLAIFVDIWLGVGYFGFAVLRTGQIENIWHFILGSLYLSRVVRIYIYIHI
jgi:hypothetical protein